LKISPSSSPTLHRRGPRAQPGAQTSSQKQPAPDSTAPAPFDRASESSPRRERLYPYRGMPVPAAYGIHWDDYDKILVERAILGNRSLPATVLRLPMVYGLGDDDGKKRRFMSYAKRMDDGRPAILLDRSHLYHGLLGFQQGSHPIGDVTPSGAIPRK
jgi:hypothetical protein